MNRDSRPTLAVLGVSGRRTAVRAQGLTVVMTLEVSVVDTTAGSLEVTLDRSAVLVLPQGASLGMRPSASASGSRIAVIGFDTATFREATLRSVRASSPPTT